MVEFKFENMNIFDADVQCLVNPVNTLGVSGKGLAREFREVFPDNDESYKLACRTGDCATGKVYMHKRQTLIKGFHEWICNFPSKTNWRNNSTLENIRKALVSLVKECDVRRIKSIAIPPVGCGLGALPEDEVIPMIEEELSKSKYLEVVYVVNNKENNNG